MFGWLRYCNWKSSTMPRGIGCTCVRSHTIQSPHPPYWTELETTATLLPHERDSFPTCTALFSPSSEHSSMAGDPFFLLPFEACSLGPFKLPMAGLGPSSSLSGVSGHGSSLLQGRWAQGSSSPMAGGVDFPQGRAPPSGVELLHGRDGTELVPIRCEQSWRLAPP